MPDIEEGRFVERDEKGMALPVDYNSSRSKALRLLAGIPDMTLRKFCEASLSPHASLDHMVKAFHQLYGLPVVKPEEAKLDFSHISRARLAMRFGLIVEEMCELFEAMDIRVDMKFFYMNEEGEYVPANGGVGEVDFNDPVDAEEGGAEKKILARMSQAIEETEERDMGGVADATFDLKYVIIGFEYEVGIDPKACALEGQASNMSKLADDGSVIRREDGKVLKGPNYFKPDMLHALMAHGLRR